MKTPQRIYFNFSDKSFECPPALINQHKLSHPIRIEQVGYLLALNKVEVIHEDKSLGLE